MARVLRWLGQAVAYGLTALLIGYLADSPPYVHLAPDRALIKLAFAHGAVRNEGCRRRTAEELERLAPNMRRQVVCPRTRVPVLIELELDGRILHRASLPPTGLSGDGPSRIYERFPVAPGRHRIVARLNDTGRAAGFDYERAADVDLRPGQSFAVDFRAEAGGLVFR
ncbi:MAG: hypothetical protein JNK11_05495 [Alphaproteobacteria bacterium]|nr:hypothetical protein [Alphaproteobacteria bacterium]